MSSNATAPVDLAPIAAPLLLGSLFNWGLFGVLSLQVYLYHSAFPNDGLFRKILVSIVYLLDAAQTFVVTGDVFEIYAKHYGEVDQLSAMHNEWLAVPVFSSIVSVMVQVYYGYRIGFLSGSKILMGLVIALSLMQGIAGIVTGAQADIIGSFQGLEKRAHSNTIVWLAGSAACDVLIAGMMAYLLLRRVSQSIQADTRASITRIVQLIVETGTLTAMAAILVLVLYVALPQRAYYSCLGAILAKLYANSLLVMFNSRMHICDRRSLKSHSRGVSRDSRAVNFGTQVGDSLSGIHVQEQVFVHTDEMEFDEPESLEMKKSDSLA